MVEAPVSSGLDVGPPALTDDESRLSRPKPYVAIFRLQLFKPSETFIAAQATKLVSYEPIFVGIKRFGEAPPNFKVVCPDLSLWQRARLLIGGGQVITRHIPVTPAVIHAHFAVDAVFAMAIARHYGVPLVVTLHGFDITTKLLSWIRSGKPALVMAALRRGQLQRSATRFLAVSEAIRTAAINKGFPAARTRTAYLGIDLEKIQARSFTASGKVVHVGRLVEKKGTSYLLYAFAAVKHSAPNARLSIIGDGPLRSVLEALADQLGLRDVVTFHGSMPHNEAVRLMSEAEIIAVPSVTAENGDREGLPTVALEAAALGRAVVGTHHSGIPEVILDGVTGLIVKERDTNGLARALVSMLHSPERTRKMGEAGRKFVAEFHNANTLTQSLETQYEELRGTTR